MRYRTFGLAACMAFAANCPSVLADLITHYDASALSAVADGTQVLTLTDTSGHNNNATKSSSAATVATYLANGIGGRASLLFTGGNSGAVTTGNASGYQSVLNLGTAFGISGDASFTEIFVLRSAGNGSSANDGVFSHIGGVGTGTSPHQAAAVEIQGNHLDIATGFSNDATLGAGSYNPLANRDLVLTVIHQGGTGRSIGSTFQIFANGFAPGQGLLSGLTIGTTGDANTAALNLANQPFSIAGAPIGTQEGFSGLLAEALVYNTALTTTERQAVESGLLSKYNIATTSVPEPHSVVLLTSGILGLLALRPRLRKNVA